MKTETMIYFKSFSVFLSAVVFVFLIGIPSVSAQNNSSIFSEQGAVSILPHMFAFPDPTGDLTIADILLSSNEGSFVSLSDQSLKTNAATYWLRFTITGLKIDENQDNYLLDLGQNIPGIAELYVAKIDVKEQKIMWKKFISPNNSIFLFPKEDNGISVVYIKLQGHPGLWFNPVLRSTYNAATTYEHMSRYVLLATLFVMMFFCLIRAVSEKNDWCFWTSLFLGFVMVKSFLGIPATPHGVVETDAMAIAVLPGISFIILVHIARLLMKSTNTASSSLGWQYLFLIIPGVLIVVLPLVPNFSWTIRYLELWPLAILLLVPTTLGAWFSDIYGSRRFLIGCLIPPIFTLLAIFGIGSSISSDLLATVPLWGVVFGTLAIMAIGNMQKQASASTSIQDATVRDATAIAMLDPSLRIVNDNEGNEDIPIISVDSSQDKNVENNQFLQDVNEGLAWEEKLRVPLDTLCIEILALKECSLPTAAEDHVGRINDLVNNLNEALKQPLDSLNDCKDLDVPLGDDNFSFDLQRIMRKAHDSVSDMAEQKNIGLSWFMPPVLGNKFVGNGQSLLHCLRLLLNNAVRATNRGAVKMSVRRVPESTDVGHLLFSVTDTGLGMPPYRSSASLGRVWELVALHKGFFGIECSPEGVSISFTLRLQAYTNEQSSQDLVYGGYAEKNVQYEDDYVEEVTPENYPTSEQNDDELVMEEFNNSHEAKSDSSIIIVDYSLSNRQLLTFFLEGLPFCTREAKTPYDCVELHFKKQALLIIFDDSLPLEEIFNAINKIRAFEMEKGLPSSLILALTNDKSQWVELHEGGCTHAMEKPITRLAFRNTIQDLLYELVGLFPAQDEKFQAKKFSSSNDSTPYNDEKELVSEYGDINLSENVVNEEGNLSNVQCLDDFISPKSKKFIGSRYNEEQDFESDILPYTPVSNPDFIDETNTIKIIYGEDKSRDGIVEDFDNNQNTDFGKAEHVNILQGKTIQETLDENIHETLDQLNNDNLVEDKIDESIETNLKNESISDFDVISQSEISHRDDVEPSLGEMQISTLQEDDYLAETAKDAQISKINALPIDVSKNGLGNNSVTLENDKAQESSDHDTISGVELLQQNSELKELMTEDEYKFFDEVISHPFEEEIEKFKEGINEVQEFKEGELSSDKNDLNEEVTDTLSDVAFQEPMPTTTSASVRDENSSHRPSLIPQSSFLLDYILDDEPSQDKISDASASNAESVNNKQNKFEINAESNTNDGNAVSAYENKEHNNEANNNVNNVVNNVANNDINNDINNDANNDANNDMLSMLNEDKEPKFENRQNKDSFSLNNLSLNQNGKSTKGIVDQNNLFLHIDTVNDVAREVLSNEHDDVKNDNIEQEYASVQDQNIMDSNNMNNIKEDVEREKEEVKVGVTQTNITDNDSGVSLSHVLASGNNKASSPIPVLLDELDKSIKYAKDGYMKNDVQSVLDAAAYIAKRTEACGLRSLSRMAICVEEAAKVKDFDAISDLLPELESAIARNRESLQMQL